MNRRNRRFLYSLFTIAAIILLTNCRSDGTRKNIRDYYFPLKALEDGMVYEYRPTGIDSLSPAYWYYRSLLQEKEKYLTGTYYEYDLVPLQFTKEEIVGNGILVQDLKLFIPDPTESDSGQVHEKRQSIDAEILAGNVFPFEVSLPSGVFLYKVRFRFPGQPGTTTLIKNRRYLGETKYEYQGKTYPGVKFEVRELIEDENPEEGTMEPQYSGEEIYAEGLGLVYYSKNIGRDTLRYELADRYPMSQLETIFRQRLNASSGQ